MKDTTHAKWLRRKRRIARRLEVRRFRARSRPMLAARNIRYDIGDRGRAIACGGIGSVHLLARRIGLVAAIDREVHLLKVHLPYHESDHVLNIAYNLLCGGDCLEDLERLRNDKACLDALGASHDAMHKNNPVGSDDARRRRWPLAPTDRLQGAWRLLGIRLFK